MVRMFLLLLLQLLLLPPDIDCQEVSGHLLSLVRPETLSANRWLGSSQYSVLREGSEIRNKKVYRISILEILIQIIVKKILVVPSQPPIGWKLSSFTEPSLSICWQLLFRMSEKDDHSFMLDYLIWMKGSTIKVETLQIYNFGYERNLPLPSIPLTPDTKLKFNLQTSGMATPSRWSLVVIGEKYVDRFDEIMEIVDRKKNCSQLRK